MREKEQISDGNGNNFIPTRDQLVLHAAGWRVAERTKRGCIPFVKWIDPNGTGTWSQATALLFLAHRRVQ